VLLNPPRDLVLMPGDELIVLAEDDDTYEPNASGPVAVPDPGPAPCRTPSPRKVCSICFGS
jgi:hypothetical protein